MCTLGVLLDRSASRRGRFPLIVAANRDESRARPSRAPFLWDEPRIIAGRDERAGGTWLGLNEHGIFAGLTNLWGDANGSASPKSRGDIVLGLLRSRSVAVAKQWLSNIDPDDYGPFQIVCASGAEGGFFAHSEDGLRCHELADGVYAFGNRPAAERPKKLAEAAASLRAAWDAREGDDGKAIATALQPALAEHRGDRGARESVCVHTEGEYGTVSSTILLVGEAGTNHRLFHAAGAPCTTPFEDLSEICTQLR